MRQPTNPERDNRTTRIVSVIAATAVALSCGTNYAFSAWEPQFAQRLRLSATEANLIGNFANIGMYALGIPGGMLVDRKGPRWGALVGVVGLACGYFALHSAYRRGEGSMSVPTLCFFSLCTGVASCTAFSAAIKVCATNWPGHRGTAMAFPLSAFGLSAFFYTTLSAFVFPDDTAGYLLLLSVMASSMLLLGMIFLTMAPPHSQYEALDTDERPALRRKDSSRSRRSPRGDSNRRSSSIQPDITGWTLLQTPAFWKLFTMLGLLCGVGLMTINNVGNTARTLWHHFDDSVSHEFMEQRQIINVGTISVFSFVGRLSSGIGSDWLVHHDASRLWTLVASACVSVAAQLVALNLDDPHGLFWLSGLTGLGYGTLFGVYPALVVDAFGSSGMGINWGAMTWAPVLSGSFFNLAYGHILDRHSTFRSGPNGHHNGESVCNDGKACYQGAYAITLAASLVGLCWSLYMIRLASFERKRAGKRMELDHNP